jgi:tRNA 2-selenouridine synthase SelU
MTQQKKTIICYDHDDAKKERIERKYKKKNAKI